MSKPVELTHRQRQVFQFIQFSLENRGRPPTVREIGEKFNITSTNGVRSILSALIKKNYIKRTPRVSRGIDLVQAKPRYTNSENTVEIPILGRIAAGSPLLAVENLEGTVVVDRDFIMRRPDVFALRVRGDSMIEAGILDGDMLFARHQNTADPGQIVVALIGDEATVKYFYPQSDKIRLEPANSSHRTIVVEENDPEFRIAGRVIGVMRRYP